MKKITRKAQKEERKDNLNEPLVVIEQDSVLTQKRVISYPFNKEKRDHLFEDKKSNRLGPGAYDLTQKRNQAQNIVSKNARFPNYENMNPGVGEYNVAESEIKVENSAPKYQIPKAERKNPFEVSKEKKGVPGIGKYKLGVNYPKNFYMEEKVERFHTIETDKPGVGEYDINDAELKLKKKDATISAVRSKRKDPFEVNKERKNVPGIGTYNISSQERKGVYIEGKKQRFETSYNGRPGVGEYDINDAEIKLKKKTGISTNRAKRKDPFEATKESKNTPGAGAYNTVVHDKNKFYMNNDLPRFKTSNDGKPGVGEYDINDAELKLKKKTGISANKSKRKDPFEATKESKNVPGTGAYNINIRETKGVYIEGKKQRFETSYNGRPGVGEYDINDAEIKLKKKTGISTSRSARNDPFVVGKEQKGKPGVGTYNINKTDIKGVYIEGNVSRFASSNDGKPGVGEYDINDAELKLKKKTGISTNKAKRKDPFEATKESKNVPGTGAYNINKTEPNKFYIEGNIERFGPTGNKNPGVGEYDINDAELKLKKKTGISTNKAKRKDPFEATKESKNVPGTGAYNISKAEQQKFYIEGNVPRFGSSNDGKPGVGEYNINDAELKLKKKTGISTNKSKRKDPFEATKESKNVPGAGAYNTIETSSRKFYIEGNVPRFGSSNDGKPGVGEYDINDAALKLKKKTGISTNKSKRKDPFEATKESKNVPGAGAYNTIATSKNKFYLETNLPRFKTSDDGKPGVGEYDINDAELKLKKNSPKAFTGRSKRNDPFVVGKEQKGKPGVGTYNINKTDIKGVYIEGNVPRFVSSNDGKPGVGEYDINDAELKLKKKTGISTNKAKRKDPFEATKKKRSF